MDEDGKPRKSPIKASSRAMPPPPTKISRPQVSTSKRASISSSTPTTPKATTRTSSAASTTKLSDSRAASKHSPASPTPKSKPVTLTKQDGQDRAQNTGHGQVHEQEHEEQGKFVAASPDTQTFRPLPWSPQDPLPQVNWLELEARYNVKMEDLRHRESEIYNDLGRLNTVFEAWATAGQHRESDRGSKRLRTRIAYVCAHEEKLRKTRNHYLQARAALQQALQTLDIAP